MTDKNEVLHQRTLRVIPDYEIDSEGKFELELDTLLRLLSTSRPEILQQFVEDAQQATRAERIFSFSSKQKSQIIVVALMEMQELPEAFLLPLMRAAIYEDNPSSNRRFIRPAIQAFGYRKVQEVLLKHLEQGTDREKAGAARAYYWAEVGLVFEGLDNYRKRKATTATQNTYDSLADLRSQIALVMLREFIENENVDVRRSLLPLLSLDPSEYPDAYKPLVPFAVDLARAHPDEYIRHRVETQVAQHGHILRKRVYFRRLTVAEEQADALLGL